MAKSKVLNRRGKGAAPRSFISYQWMVLRVVVVAAIIALIVFFRSVLGSIIFEAIGFGLILWLAWIGLIAFSAWKRMGSPQAPPLIQELGEFLREHLETGDNLVLLAALRRIEEGLVEAETQVTCPQCGEVTPRSQTSCQHCGEKLPGLEVSA